MAKQGIPKPLKKAPAKKAPAKKGAVKKTKPKSPEYKLFTKSKNLKILKKDKFRDIEIKVHYKDGVIDKQRLWRDWVAVTIGLEYNPRVFASNTYLYYEHNDQIQAYPLTRAEVKPKLDGLINGYNYIVDKYLVKLLDDLKIISLTVHVIFKAKYLKGK